MGDDKRPDDSQQQEQQSLADLIDKAEGMGTLVQRDRFGGQGADNKERRG